MAEDVVSPGDGLTEEGSAMAREPDPAWPDWPDDERIMISALEHWSYCPRQCGLIHLDQVFEQNVYTVRGDQRHERVDSAGYATSNDVRTVRALPLWSDRLGLTGRADIVEFRGERPTPVEYKSGARREWKHEALQLCAQALCLEEMFGCSVPEGVVFYHTTRNRRLVRFDPSLRSATERAVLEIRAMLAGSVLPPAMDDARCPQCSLNDACLPALTAAPARIRGWAGELFRPPAEG